MISYIITVYAIEILHLTSLTTSCRMCVHVTAYYDSMSVVLINYRGLTFNGNCGACCGACCGDNSWYQHK